MAASGSSFILDGLVNGVQLLLEFDPEVWSIIWVSVYVSLTSTCVATLVGVPLGVGVGLGRFPGRRLIIVILNALLALPTVLVGLLGYALLSRRGPLAGLDWLFTTKAMVLGQVILIVPLIAALTAAAVSRLDKRVMRTALSLGATRLSGAWQVVREGRLALLAAVMAGFGRVFGEVGVSMMLGGNIYGRTRNIPTAIALQSSMGEFALGVALGLVLLLVAFLMNAALYWIRGRTR